MKLAKLGVDEGDILHTCRNGIMESSKLSSLGEYLVYMEYTTYEAVVVHTNIKPFAVKINGKWESMCVPPPAPRRQLLAALGPARSSNTFDVTISAITHQRRIEWREAYPSNVDVEEQLKEEYKTTFDQIVAGWKSQKFDKISTLVSVHGYVAGNTRSEIGFYKLIVE